MYLYVPLSLHQTTQGAPWKQIMNFLCTVQYCTIYKWAKLHYCAFFFGDRNIKHNPNKGVWFSFSLPFIVLYYHPTEILTYLNPVRYDMLHWAPCHTIDEDKQLAQFLAFQNFWIILFDQLDILSHHSHPNWRMV